MNALGQRYRCGPNAIAVMRQGRGVSHPTIKQSRHEDLITGAKRLIGHVHLECNGLKLGLVGVDANPIHFHFLRKNSGGVR